MEEKNDEDLMTYCQHLEALHSDFNKRFEDILQMDILKWVLDPFSNTETIDSAKLEEELIEVTTNKELKLNAVTNLFTKKRQQLQITNRGDLRILLTKIEPNINELLVKHQPHPSH
ncbi:Hypothetical protein CINCED_3A005983 [Cinara cedri]|uniref:Uncharacterized protein n=1 Tax=Cinara cedri TaxID=506608 RepID=A0A5E4MIC1_9HEMI|nr:Hypothetical protein CINCED_3A005983 [Cinara cedri]